MQRSAHSGPGETSLIVQPIGDEPDALLALHPDLNIWDAYETIHLLMPDGSMKLGGDAVAEVLRSLPNTKWFAWRFAVSILGFQPFQMILNMSCVILADVRPFFGCESCGTPSWLRPIERITVLRASKGSTNIARPKPIRRISATAQNSTQLRAG